MIKIFYGNDRVKAQAEIRRWLGEDYEVVEGAELTPAMMPSLFLGTSLFAEKRRIAVKDLGENKEVFAKLVEYVGTEHEVALWESTLDKRTVAYKALAKAGVEAREFKLPEKIDRNAVFKIYDAALLDGARAVEMLTKIQDEQDPYMIVGAFAWKAIDIFDKSRGMRGRAQLKKLAELDLALKSSTMDPWLLVKKFLLGLATETK